MVSAPAGAPAVLLTGATMADALHEPALLYEATRFTVEEMGLDSLCLVVDLSLEAEACGCRLRFGERDLPMVLSHPLQGPADPRRLEVPDPQRDGRMPVFLEAMRRLERHYTIMRTAVVTGPFTLATHLAGSEIYLDTATDPEAAGRILEYCTEVILAYARALIRAGADMIAVAEPAGSQLSPAAYDAFSQVYSQRIMSSLPSPCILHVCGKAGHVVDSMCRSGAQGISVDDVDLSSLVQRAPEDVVILGNVGTMTLARCTPEEVRAETLEVLRCAGDRKAFVAAPGCDLAPETPLENIRVFVQTVKAHC
jgi:MtaA/CmuA family methyltransferase